MNIDQLNKDFGLTDQLSFVKGEGGFPFIQICNRHAEALISIYGGQVLSFKPNGSEDLLFLSKKAYYEDGKAIKGGIPVCWPWFGPHAENTSLPGHGFVRNRMWNVLGTETTDDDSTKVILGLQSSPETLGIWPHSFSLVVEVTVGGNLHVELITRNTGSQSFSITQAFHTYFSISDITQISVSGLEGKQYIDKVDNDSIKKQDGGVTISSEVDRIYSDVPEILIITDSAMKRKIQIKSKGNNKAVVWNPWAEISTKSGDLKDDDYERFVCVETANAVDDAVEIPAGEEFRLTAEISV